MNSSWFTTTTLTVLCLLSSFAACDFLRVIREASETPPPDKEEEVAKQRELLLGLRLINEVGFNLGAFRDRAYADLQEVKATQNQILLGVKDIQDRLARLEGGKTVDPSAPSTPATTTRPPVTNNPFIRLVNGSTPFEGRVEVFVGQAWGTVCDDSFDTLDAGVVCYMMNFSRANALPVSSRAFGMGTGPIIFDDLRCVGDEEDLKHCPTGTPLFESNCQHSEDAGVICRPA